MKPGSRKVPGERGIAHVTLPSGEVVYRVQLSGRKVGGRRLSAYRPTLAAAQALKAEWLAGGGPAAKDAPAPPTAEPTVEDGLRRYGAELARRGQDPGRVLQLLPVLERAGPELLRLPLEAVTLGHLYDFRQRREAAKKKPNTIRRDLGVLRSMLKRARPDFTVPDDVFPVANDTRVRVLGATEERLSLLAVPEPFRTMVRLAKVTLMRLSDIRTLERGMVDLGQGVAFLPATKTGPRSVTLGTEAVQLLRAQLKRHVHALVFPSPAGVAYSRVHVSRVWRRAIRGAGRPDFTFHDLKHHGAMRALAEGASFPELQGLGGWRTPSMVNRYASVTAERVRALQDQIGRRRAKR